MNINLRNVPVAAAAALLAALERHGGAPEVPDTWAAQRMAREIQALARPGPRRVR